MTFRIIAAHVTGRMSNQVDTAVRTIAASNDGARGSPRSTASPALMNGAVPKCAAVRALHRMMASLGTLASQPPVRPVYNICYVRRIPRLTLTLGQVVECGRERPPFHTTVVYRLICCRDAALTESAAVVRRAPATAAGENRSRKWLPVLRQ